MPRYWRFYESVAPEVVAAAIIKAIVERPVEVVMPTLFGNLCAWFGAIRRHASSIDGAGQRDASSLRRGRGTPVG